MPGELNMNSYNAAKQQLRINGATPSLKPRSSKNSISKLLSINISTSPIKKGPSKTSLGVRRVKSPASNLNRNNKKVFDYKPPGSKLTNSVRTSINLIGLKTVK